MESLSDRLDRVRARLQDLIDRDTNRQIFGADETWGGQPCGHFYFLNPPIRKNVLSRFENKHHIVLPEEYREFLLTICNGRAGPGYGLQPLNESFVGYMQQPLTPSQSFPYSNADADQIIRDYLDEPQRGIEAWLNHTVALGTNGYICLSDHGCGERSILIVSGEQRGKVWYAYERHGHPQFMGDRQDCKTLGFLDWYENWVIESLRSLADSC